MGKREKEHRKRVQKRNDRINAQKRAYEKMMKLMMEQHVASLKENQNASSAITENISGFIQSPESI